MWRIAARKPLGSAWMFALTTLYEVGKVNRFLTDWPGEEHIFRLRLHIRTLHRIPCSFERRCSVLVIQPVAKLVKWGNELGKYWKSGWLRQRTPTQSWPKYVPRQASKSKSNSAPSQSTVRMSLHSVHNKLSVVFVSYAGNDVLEKSVWGIARRLLRACSCLASPTYSSWWRFDKSTRVTCLWRINLAAKYSVSSTLFQNPLGSHGSGRCRGLI